MIQLAVGEFYRMRYDTMRGWGEQALAAAQDLSEPPLTAASTAVVAVAAAFLGAVVDAKVRSSEAAALVDALGDDELGLRLDASRISPPPSCTCTATNTPASMRNVAL